MDAALREMGAGCDRLHHLLEDQAYRLAYWKIAFEEINYRRFFDINDLVCLRVEEEDVFLARHQIIFQLVAEGKVTGLRVDHVDGLHDPEGYLARCRAPRVRPSPKGRYTWWWRRFWAGKKRSRGPGRYVGPRDTIS